MYKYCKIINDETGLVQIGAGCSDEYYIEIGMVKKNVRLSEMDGEWYLYDKCPVAPKPTPKERETEFLKEFFSTSLGYIRRSVTMQNGNKKDFLSDLLPVISMGVQSGQEVKIIAYTMPDFTEDVTDWTQYQHIEIVTPQFIQECFLQLSNDFLPNLEEENE